MKALVVGDRVVVVRCTDQSVVGLTGVVERLGYSQAVRVAFDDGRMVWLFPSELAPAGEEGTAS